MVFILLLVCSLWLGSCLAFNVATSRSPTFNHYDPSMLEKLQNKDQSAGIVSRKSNKRPTYCENMYYRDVTNGGQGESSHMMQFLIHAVVSQFGAKTIVAIVYLLAGCN